MSLTTKIKPSQINTDRHFTNAFGHFDTETAARLIVRFCAQGNGDTWKPFKLDDLEDFYNDGFSFPFFRLIEGRFVAVDLDSRLVAVTHQFVERCHEASPAS